MNVDEIMLKEQHEARMIVHEVINHGVTERQKMLIMKYIAEHLEDYAVMQLMAGIVDELLVRDGDSAKMQQLRESALARMQIMVGSR